MIAGRQEARHRGRTGCDLQAVLIGFHLRVDDGEEAARALAEHTVGSVPNDCTRNAGTHGVAFDDEPIPRTRRGARLGLEIDRAGGSAANGERPMDRQLHLGGVAPRRLTVGAGKLHCGAGLDRQKRARRHRHIALHNVGAARWGPGLVDDVAASDRGCRCGRRSEGKGARGQ